MSTKKAKKKASKGNSTSSTGWLQIIESEPPRFFCPVIEEELMESCSLRGCLLWTPNTKVYSCVGAFGGMKASNSEERLQATSANQRDKRGTLRSAAHGKLSFYDLAHLYILSRQRVEGFVSFGRRVIEVLTPLMTNIDVTTERKLDPATKRLGSPTLFSRSGPTSYEDPDTGEVTRVCVCCECVIEPDDDELILAILDRDPVAWCSKECNKDMPIDAYLVSHRYKRHWVSVALAKDPVDERSRVREITTERMTALEASAKEQGYA